MKYIFWVAILYAVLVCQLDLRAQPPILNAPNGDIGASDTETTEQAAQVEEPPTAREEVAEKLRVAKRALDSAKETSEQSNVKPPERLQREVELLKQLEVTIAQRDSAKSQHADLQTRLSDLKGQLESVRDVGPSEEKPYSFLLLDHLRDDLKARKDRADTLQAESDATQKAVVSAKEALAAREQAQRRAKETEHSNADESKKSELETAVKLADFEIRIANEFLMLKKQELINEGLSQQIQQTQIDLVEEKIKWISKAVIFSQQDLQDQLVEIEKQEADLKNSIRSAEFNQQYAESELLRARQQLDSAPEKRAGLVEQVEARQLTRQNYQLQVTLFNARLQRLVNVRQLWNQRFAVIRDTASTEELITWGKETRAIVDQLLREKRLEQMRIDELRQDIANREKKLQAVNGQDAEARTAIERQRDQLSQLIQLHDANIVSIEGTQQLAEKLIAEIEGDVQSWTLMEWVAGAWHYVSLAWETVVITVDDNPLTVGKLIVGIILLFAGFLFSRWLSRWLGQRLQQGRVGLNESAAAAIQSLSFYVFLIFCTVSALRFVNVPLTMFTFLGGAIAIGVGFGSQNIINNFISGLILLAERPIKVGDLIQMDDLYGTVQRIGARSTQIRTGNNLDIIVPNSSFLESNVVNLTLGDDRYRTQVNVGVIYGSPTRDVTRLLKHAAVEHGRVLDRPEPFVWFSEFGDNALIFELHFWVKVRTVSDRRRIESDIRYRIDQLFREAGLVIAFPQRDIHLDTTSPIDVRLFSAGELTGSSNDSTINAA